MKQSEVKVGQRVVATDGVSRRGTTVGTITRLLGRKGLGGGVHARVQWDSGSSGIHRPDHIEIATSTEDV